MTRQLSTALAAAALLTACAASARAKVVFTGYGDFQVTPQSRFTIDGPPSVLSRLGTGPETIESRGATINALGLFATTTINDQTKMTMDVTYEGVGSTVKTLTIPYAYVEYADYGGIARLGKITLPFNYYNENRFYPFQHASITGPLFQSAILGLPIADIGALVERPFPVGAGVTLTANLYGVNGYGPSTTSTGTFRDTGLLSSSLSIANNIGSGNHNHDIAFGGRLQAAQEEFPDSSVGVSYYHDRWDTGGQDLFQMAGAHLHAVYRGFDWLTEYLMLNAKGDAGAVPNFGAGDWRTDGFFSEVDYVKLFLWKKQVTPWIRYEDYMTHAVGGSQEKERLTNLGAGASIRVMDGLTLKAEFRDLYYRLPYQGAGDLELKGYSVAGAATVTF